MPNQAFKAAVWLGVLLPACGLSIADPASAQPAPPSFTVSVTLSPRAAARLASLGESIIVDAAFWGEPIPAARKQADEMGQLDLGEEKVVIPGHDGTATITGRTIAMSKLGLLRNRDIKVLINVYTARRKNPDNLLACDIFEDSVTLAQRTPMHLACKLIGEGP